MIKLGNRVKDTVSGLVGIATARTEFLNGCVRYTVQPPYSEHNKECKDYWFDEQQLEVIDAGILVEAKRTGGPTSSTPPTISKPNN